MVKKQVLWQKKQLLSSQREEKKVFFNSYIAKSDIFFVFVEIFIESKFNVSPKNKKNLCLSKKKLMRSIERVEVGKGGGHISAPYMIQNALLRSNCTFFIKAFLKMK